MARNSPPVPTTIPAVALATRYSPEETREQYAYVSNGLISGLSTADVRRGFLEKFGANRKNRFHTMFVRAMEAFKTEDAARRDNTRSEAVRRITRRIPRLDSQIHAPATPTRSLTGLVLAVATHEKLLADIQGTRAPIKIDVDVRVSESIAHVIMNLTPEQVTEYQHRNAERKRMAAAYEAQMAALPRKAG